MVKHCAYCGRQETEVIVLNDDRMCNACEYVQNNDIKGARKVHSDKRAELEKKYKDSLEQNDGQ